MLTHLKIIFPRCFIYLSGKSLPRVSIIPGATWGCNGWPWPSIGVKDGGTILAINHRDAANTTILYQPILVINHRDTSIPCHAAPKLRPESISLCFQQSRQRLSSVGCSKPRVWCQLLGSQRSVRSQHQTLSVCLLHHFHWHQPSWCSFYSALAVDNNQPPSLNISAYFLPIFITIWG